MADQQGTNPFQVFSVDTSQVPLNGAAMFAKTDIASLGARVMEPDGGETNIHAHTASEGVWLVQSGQATFYDGENNEVATLTVNDGVLVPRGTKYWFKNSSSTDNLVILRFGALDQKVKDERVDYTERTAEDLALAAASTASYS